MGDLFGVITLIRKCQSKLHTLNLSFYPLCVHVQKFLPDMLSGPGFH